MCAALPDCLVTGHMKMIDELDLPDPDDRHVLAAAIRSDSRLIVTENLDDFPPDVLRHHDLEALTPDVFVLRLVDHAPTTVLRALEAQADALRAPPIGLDDLLTQLATCSLPRSVASIRSHLR